MEITPTVGYSTEQFQKNNIHFTVFDMSGQSKFRSLWESFYSDCDGVIFVVDSTDRLRMAIAQNELHQLVQHKGLIMKQKFID